MNVSDETLKLIDEIVRGLAPSYTFGYFDVEDLEQEGRMFGLDGLTRYNPEKGASLKTFLITHIKNRYLTLRRDRYIRTAPKNLSPDALDTWLRKHAVKKNLIDTVDIDDERNEGVYTEEDNEVTAPILNKELSKIIDKYLPIELRADYRCILEDVKIPKSRRDKVLEILRGILNEYTNREKEG